MSNEEASVTTPNGHHVALQRWIVDDVLGWRAFAERSHPETGWSHTVGASEETLGAALAAFDKEWQRLTNHWHWAYLAEQACIPLELLPLPHA